jgi:nucleotide-binding universal stress UspA family protein
MAAATARTSVLGMSDPTVLAAYDASAEGADGLALAELLAGLTGAEVLVARVLQDMVEHPGATRGEQRDVRRRVDETRLAILAAVPDREPNVMPVVDAKLARALHDVADNEGATFLVLGSSHYRGLGRVLLGGSAEMVVAGSPCPVAVAAPGFRSRPTLEPAVIGVAFDGSPASEAAVRTAASLAGGAGVALRLVAIDDGDRGAPAALDALAPVAGVGQEQRVVRRGSAADELVAETRGLGMLVMGARGLGVTRSALLGSVSTSVLRRAQCPVIVCPAGR